ncbi:MAG: 50S ribosomal protein L19 [Deltaproteobacteria bacterium CG11_big_fil_rev_8_21_14_0_20_45_16]|nr:MAG: 50S ribosomal protein L19 [Deltaproteobacteria bacterium CG11_big_fil_rev_8_21_14_0_20_45_16]
MKKRLDPTKIIKKVSAKILKEPAKFPKFGVGDTVRVFVRVVEGEKTRIQPYEGLVIRIKKGGERASFTVRKISNGVGVERIFPFYSPVIDRIVLVSEGEVRRAKLYYLRALSGRASRIKSEYIFEDTQKGGAEPTDGDESKADDVSAKAAQA